MSNYIFKRDEINNLFNELRKYGLTEAYTWGTVQEDSDKLRKIAKQRGYKGKMNKTAISKFLKDQIKDAEKDIFIWEELPQYDPDNVTYTSSWREEADRIAHPTYLPEFDSEYVRDWKEIQRQASKPNTYTEKECKMFCDRLTKKGFPLTIDLIPLSRWSRKQTKRFQTALINYFNNIIGNEEYPTLRLNIELGIIDESGTVKTLIYPLNSKENYKDFYNSLHGEEFLSAVRMPDKEEYYLVSDPVINKMISWNFITDFTVRQVKDKKALKKTRNGNFFPYTYKKELAQIQVIKDALSKMQIYDNVRYHIDEYSRNCLIYALEQVEGLDKKVIKELKRHICKEWVQGVTMDTLFKEYDLHGRIRYYEEDDKIRYLVNTGNDFSLNLYNEHYFIDAKLPFTLTWLYGVLQFNGLAVDLLPRKAIEYFDLTKCNYRWNTAKQRWVNASSESSKFIDTMVLLKTLQKYNVFIPMTYNDLLVLPNEDEGDIMNEKITWIPKTCIKSYDELHKKSGTQKVISEKCVYFADFEADTHGEYHRAYAVSVQNMVSDSLTRHFKGRTCAKQLLEFLPSGSVIYFHNLKYDFNFIFPYLECGESIQKGSKILSFNGKFEKKVLTFKDSYSMIVAPIKKFPEMFDLGEIQKEEFPYDYYTLERYQNEIGNISEASKHCKDSKQFIKNIDKIEGCRLSEDTFNMQIYNQFYCDQDVNILKKGFIKFRELTKEALNLDPLQYLTAPALANAYFTEHVYSKDSGIKYYSGSISQYIRAACYGGRCMCAYNRKWHTLIKLFDFDACSLYPSAMARLEIPLGAPKILTEEQCKNKSFMKWVNAYICTIRITKVNKHRAFPLIIQRTKEGNEYDDNIPPEGLICVVDNIYLEDLIKFQQIEYEVIQGIFWSEGTNDSIQKIIRDVYKKRREYKNQGNPIQEIFKLVMNSAYGKTIQKFIDSQIRVINEENEEAFWDKNYHSIIYAEKVKGFNKIIFHQRKTVQDQFTPCLIGVQILSMSKRIMNEVMCLAEDLGIKIFYQDTDSMHIEADKIELLANEYNKLYERKLIGKDMGQFHNDFDSDKGTPEYAVESYFIGKKIYVDKLQLKEGGYDYHVRCKGISREAIDAVVKDGDYIKLYKQLYNGDSIQFDLAAGVSFNQNSNYTINTNIHFYRNIKGTYEEGIPEEYFNY